MRYHDVDYAYDYTNPVGNSRWQKEKEARAKACAGFMKREHDNEICGACYGPRYAHKVTEATQKAS